MRGGEQPSHGDGVDDMRLLAAGAHFRQEGAQHVQMCVQIDAEQPAPSLLVDVFHRAAGGEHAGVVAENAHRAECLLPLLLGAGPSGGVGGINNGHFALSNSRPTNGTG